MGCSGSKLDDLEAVSLCRRRSNFIAAAVRHRYAFSAAHAAYADSLRSIGASLHRLLLHLDPVVQRKSDVPPPAAHRHSHSGSHIGFHSDSDDSATDSPLHSGGSSPAGTLGGSTFVSLQYARGQPPPPSVSFVQQSEGYHYATQNPNFQNYSTPNSSSPPQYYSFFEPSPPTAAPPPSAAGPSSSFSSLAPPPPPPPPPPPETSTWDFLNPFGCYDSYYHRNLPSKELREEEEEQEIVKEVYSDQSFVSSTSEKIQSSTKDDGTNPYLQSLESGSSTDDEEDVVEKSVAHEERPSVVSSATPPPPPPPPPVSLLTTEIKAQFDRASDSALEISRILEVGKHPYRRKNLVYQASSRMMLAMTASPSSKSGDHLIFEEDVVMNSKSLSSALHKLYMWEKKLYDEVRAEEKMQLLHDKNCKKLEHLDARGAEAQKIDSTRRLVKSLSTKIRIAVLVVDSISKKINKLRDEELWPQIRELVQGLRGMWKGMLECHRIQHQTISRARSLDLMVSDTNLSDRMEVVMQIELELLRWIASFSDWIAAQKNFVKSLNGWLTLCLNYQPEETPDGIPPYSPGRIGAPTIFAACNQWSQAMDVISEKEAVEAMRVFASDLRNLWKKNELEQRQKMVGNTDAIAERDAKTIQKEVEALNKKLALVYRGDGLPFDGSVALRGSTTAMGSLQLGLKQIFESMESFTVLSLKAYEELQLRCEEEPVARENMRVS